MVRRLTGRQDLPFRQRLTAVSLDGVLTEPAAVDPPDRAVLAAAAGHANLPTLVTVLAQLTGDPRWLADPYRPTRSRGMEDNDGGGYAPDVAAEIRDAAVDAVLAWYDGRPPALPAAGNAVVSIHPPALPGESPEAIEREKIQLRQRLAELERISPSDPQARG